MGERVRSTIYAVVLPVHRASKLADHLRIRISRFFADLPLCGGDHIFTFFNTAGHAASRVGRLEAYTEILFFRPVLYEREDGFSVNERLPFSRGVEASSRFCERLHRFLERYPVF